ncbi:AvrD family protein [Pseudolactococcus plantarum]|uniref:Uncharacterized protein n=1 Tax=Pseudolactococcus plantarum TaxID=1365 RepID=A0A2A5RY12_9LACT|nr:AvrD family protein [Lactococcus plantarum]PCS06122.1 hypothetical protein RU87_GL000318 [Lactococcus plantarum]HCN75049.1 hypothetical protein [Lactococcus sp.]
MLVDKILGRYDERYFGNGHKQTTYSDIFDFKEDEAGYLGYIALTQKLGWSKKKNIALTPHLSSLDGIILAIGIVEKYLEIVNSPHPIASLFNDSFEIKAGATPIEDLTHIPIRLKTISEDQNRYLAKVTILGMKISLSLTAYDTTPSSLNSVGSINYTANHLKNSTHDLVNIDLLSEKYAICDVVREVIHDASYQGLASDHSHTISILEWLIIVSQFAQVMAYNFDDIDRCDSDTLWMRTIKAKIKKPFQDVTPIMLMGEIVKSTSLKRGADEWRILELQGGTIDEDVMFSGNIAHKIPKERGDNR